METVQKQRTKNVLSRTSPFYSSLPPASANAAGALLYSIPLLRFPAKMIPPRSGKDIMFGLDCLGAAALPIISLLESWGQTRSASRGASYC